MEVPVAFLKKCEAPAFRSVGLIDVLMLKTTRTTKEGKSGAPIKVSLEQLFSLTPTNS
ncbi:MAG: hypothetical protein GX799_11020 [Crenarchaeota archaeon]|nr:hypothetical protein [Thermoproteota archaeon]